MEILIEKYAPVLIPTLCRFEHFRNCLESLRRCTHAGQTEVFIALDYPAKPEHEEGYRRICNYLDGLIGEHGFGTLNIIRRDRNYGLGMNGNLAEAQDKILQMYDRIILSEDDNVFSPNFLDYMNKGLKLFENDQSVLSINGYRYDCPIRFDGNNYFRQHVGISGWGYGAWRDRKETCLRKINHRYFVKILFNPSALWRIRKNGYDKLLSYAGFLLEWDGLVIDSTLNIYMAVEKIDVIMPALSLVRNCGWDGSGENCQTTNNTLREQFCSSCIDDAYYFDYQGDPYRFYKENCNLIAKNGYSRIGFGSFIVRLGKLFIRKLLK